MVAHVHKAVRKVKIKASKPPKGNSVKGKGRPKPQSVKLRSF